MIDFATIYGNQNDEQERGHTRRDVARLSVLLAGAGAMAAAEQALWAQSSGASQVAVTARIGTNECWVGPFTPALDATAKILARCNFYSPGTEVADFVAAVAKVENVPSTHVAPWPGSSDPLCRTVIAFCSSERGLVTADPSYELPWSVAEWAGVKITKTPLTTDYRHDVKAMLAADPNAGLYYICSPNNPTGTVTPIEDIEWLVANKPAGSIVVVDEAYLHFSNARPATHLVAQGKDVVILRTFSKLFGMAGMRLGITLARPDLHERLFRYDGAKLSRTTPVPALVSGTVSLQQADLIAARKAEMIATRTAAFAHLTKRGIRFIPSDANMFMVDWNRPAKDVRAQFSGHGVDIGRSWPIWPTVSRITVGSAADMQRFRIALDKIVT